MSSFPGPTELTLEGLIDREQVKAVLVFKEPLTQREANLVRQGWERGLEQGRGWSGNATITDADVSSIESLSDAAIRSEHTQIAIEGYALALRLRGETGLHPKRRETDHD